MKIFKCALKKISCVLFYLFRVFKVKNNKIVFFNFLGQGYGDSPKYIAEKLLDSGQELDIVWIVNEKYDNIPNKIRQVKKFSISFIYELATAKVWINNQRFPYFVKKRKEQYYIQTWHGGFGLKKIEFDIIEKLHKDTIKSIKNDNEMIDLMISDCKFFNNRIRNTLKYNGNILESGLPRTDNIILNKKEIKEKMMKKFKIEKDEKVALYCPTFRDEFKTNPYNIDFSRLKATLEKSTKYKWNIMVKLHPNIKNLTQLIECNTDFINVSQYDDIYELIALSDLIITDYSSTISDALIADIPLILYCSDFEEYNNQRGSCFEYDLLPMRINYNNDELNKMIETETLDKIVQKQQKLKEEIGFFLDGKASEQISKIILEKIN